MPIFTYKLWWLVVGYAVFMLVIGSWEAAGRPSQTYKVLAQSLPKYALSCIKMWFNLPCNEFKTIYAHATCDCCQYEQVLTGPELSSFQLDGYCKTLL